MYVPSRFKKEDHGAVFELIRENPFATVITHAEDGKVFVNHLPILVDSEDRLFGHLARANPQWNHFERGEEAVLVFHGPHTYITPSWYQINQGNVPTWNYAVVHVSVRARVIHDYEGLHSILDKSVAVFEAGVPKPWKFDFEEEEKKQLIAAIVGLEFEITGIEGKFKISQNRTPSERDEVMTGLAGRKDEMSRRVLALMKREYS